MEETVASRYWCHMCSQMVNPTIDFEMKCPLCQSGFVEEMGNNPSNNHDTLPEFGSDHALSLWAPVLMGMVGNSRRHQRSRRRDSEEDEELDSITHRQRSLGTVLQLLQSLRSGMASELENSEGGRNRERVILINRPNQTIIVQGFPDSNEGQSQTLDDYFIGPGLDLLLQQLAENDPNRYGTPPAKKDAVEAMPTVRIEENLQCSICLDDFEIGVLAKEMPCKHSYHSECILRWLELHSSCPVCRFQMPTEESKPDSDSDRSRVRISIPSGGEEGDGDGRRGNGRMFSILWPFNSLFSSSASQTEGGNSSSTASSSSSSSSSSNGGSASHTNDDS